MNKFCYFRLSLNDTYSNLLRLYNGIDYSVLGLLYCLKGKSYLVLQGINDYCPISINNYQELITYPLASKMEQYHFNKNVTEDDITRAILSIPFSSKGISYFFTFFKSLDPESKIDDKGIPESKIIMKKEEVLLNSLKELNNVDKRNKEMIAKLLKEENKENSVKIYKKLEDLQKAISQDSNFIDLSLVREAFNDLAISLGYHKKIDTVDFVLDISSLYEDEKKKIFTKDVNLSLLTIEELYNILLQVDSKSGEEEFAKKVLKEIYDRQKI